MKKDPKIFLIHILECIEAIEEYSKGLTEKQFLKDQRAQDAIVRRFEIIGEATKHLPSSLKDKYPKVQWREIMSMRDRLIHEYFNVMMDLVWETVKKDLPKFKKQIQKMVQ